MSPESDSRPDSRAKPLAGKPAITYSTEKTREPSRSACIAKHRDSAGTQIGLTSPGAILYDRKCIGRVLCNAQHYEFVVTDIVFKVEAADGLSSVVYESVDRSVGPRVSLRITVGED